MVLLRFENTKRGECIDDDKNTQKLLQIRLYFLFTIPDKVVFKDLPTFQEKLI